MPKRTSTHVTGDRGILALQNSLPDSWIFRQTTHDYGIDGEIEIVSQTDQVTGAIVKVQVKASMQDNLGKAVIRIPRSLVLYWLSLPVPVIIVRAGPLKDVKWLEIRDYFIGTETLESAYKGTSKTIAFRFKQAHSFPSDANELLRIARKHQVAVSAMRRFQYESAPAQFAACVLLVHVFKSNIDSMIKWYRKKGSEGQLESDLPLVLWLKKQLQNDPSLMARIKKAVADNT